MIPGFGAKVGELPPDPATGLSRRGWRVFLRAHASTLLAADFFHAGERGSPYRPRTGHRGRSAAENLEVLARDAVAAYLRMEEEQARLELMMPLLITSAALLGAWAQLCWRQVSGA